MVQQNHSILVAEDNIVLSEVMRFNLALAGFEVVVAANGRIALEQLERRSFDLLITDFQMPQLDGEGLCRAVRERWDETQLPILMCSAKGFEIDTERLRCLYHVAEVIYKPFSMRETVCLARSLIRTTPAVVTQ